MTSFLNQEPINVFELEEGYGTTEFPTTTEEPFLGRKKREIEQEEEVLEEEAIEAAYGERRILKREADAEKLEADVNDEESEKLHIRKKRESFRSNDRLEEALFRLKNVTKENCR